MLEMTIALNAYPLPPPKKKATAKQNKVLLLDCSVNFYWTVMSSVISFCTNHRELLANMICFNKFLNISNVTVTNL